MSFKESVTFECGTTFVKYMDCKNHEVRNPAAKLTPDKESCTRLRRDMQTCIIGVYIESVCSQHLFDLLKCTDSQAGLGTPAAVSASNKCADVMSHLELCCAIAVRSDRSDASFRAFLQHGRSWRSPTKGRHSLMQISSANDAST